MNVDRAVRFVLCAPVWVAALMLAIVAGALFVGAEWVIAMTDRAMFPDP